VNPHVLPVPAFKMTDVHTLQAELRLDPHNAALWQALVDLAYDLEDRALLVEALVGLGEALLHGGDRQRAEASFEQVLQLDPRESRARQALGRANSQGFVSFPGHKGAG